MMRTGNNNIFKVFSFVVLLAIYTTAAADDTTDIDQINGNRAALQRDGDQAMLFNFREGKFTKLSSATNDLQISAFLPADEFWQGLFANYRAAGHDRLAALQAVYAFQQ